MAPGDVLEEPWYVDRLRCIERCDDLNTLQGFRYLFDCMAAIEDVPDRHVVGLALLSAMVCAKMIRLESQPTSPPLAVEEPRRLAA